jgi:hypothetical protein
MEGYHWGALDKLRGRKLTFNDFQRFERTSLIAG